MRFRSLITIGLALMMVPALTDITAARMAIDQDDSKSFNSTMASAIPAEQVADHGIGKLVLTVSNIGTFGDGFLTGIDPFTGRGVKSCEYPKGSGVRYMFSGAFWIGAVVGRDTLVSVGADGWSYTREMHPDEAPNGYLLHRSLIDPSDVQTFEGAISECDIIATYTDTLTAGIGNDDIDNRPHRPLRIKVVQSSYAWSYSYAEDFVLFDYKITNTNLSALNNVFMGLYVDADVGLVATCDATDCFKDDVCGFVHAVPETLSTPHGEDCTYLDTVNIAWIADNDGDPTNEGSFNEESCPHITAVRIVRTPSDKLEVSFNWWISNMDPSMDFGPREKADRGQWQEPFRDFGGNLGTPMGDRNKYYIMRNREFDYDQIYTASIRPDDSLWLYPNPSQAIDFANGFDTRYLLSFGPFDIDPGETLPLSFAYVAGENFHTVGDNAENIATSPEEYYANLNFKDLTDNARWASWIYDNPGVDTDGDGDSGKSIICVDSTETDSGFVFDTAFYYVTGDGIPDFEGAKPPPAPDFNVLTEVGRLTIRFNGQRSETTSDEFLARATNNLVRFDFEGYRVYLGRDERAASYSLMASYDREDYNKYVFTIDEANPNGIWMLFDTPYTLDSLKDLYEDTLAGEEFVPLDYPRTSPFAYMDSVFYFTSQDFNAWRPGIDTDIRKRFPDQPYPSSLDPLLANPDELTEEGNLKYFEYEIVADNLLPSVAYWVNVTAFDFGSPKSGLASLESSKTVGAKAAYAMASADAVKSANLPVYVYPNPYRTDENYRERGFEGRGSDEISRSDDRVRKINFANVPSRCKISIFSIDGDLVKEFEHNSDPTDATSTHASWNLITRNTQQAVSGIYYWTVENLDTGEIQVGKFVIIM